MVVPDPPGCGGSHHHPLLSDALTACRSQFTLMGFLMSALLYALDPPLEDPTPSTRQPFTFDMTQPDAGGMVLIDACVPSAMASIFLSLLLAFKPAT